MHAKLALLGHLRWHDEDVFGHPDDVVWFTPQRLWISSANLTSRSRQSLEFGFWTEDVTAPGPGDRLDIWRNDQDDHTRATDTLGQIEELGWRLEHFASVFVETETNSRGKVMSSGEVTRTSGYVEGISLFRRTASS